MSALWTAEDLAVAAGGVMTRPFAADGVSIDTRTVGVGDLFVALHGENRDGHVFVEIGRASCRERVYDDV